MTEASTIRLATVDQIIADILPHYLSPIPHRLTVKDWFDRAGIPRFKTNPSAKRGGGPVYYSIPAVEKFLRQRTMPRC